MPPEKKPTEKREKRIPSSFQSRVLREAEYLKPGMREYIVSQRVPPPPPPPPPTNDTPRDGPATKWPSRVSKASSIEKDDSDLTSILPPDYTPMILTTKDRRRSVKRSPKPQQMTKAAGEASRRSRDTQGSNASADYVVHDLDKDEAKETSTSSYSTATKRRQKSKRRHREPSKKRIPSEQPTAIIAPPDYENLFDRKKDVQKKKDTAKKTPETSKKAVRLPPKFPSDAPTDLVKNIFEEWQRDELKEKREAERTRRLARQSQAKRAEKTVAQRPLNENKSPEKKSPKSTASLEEEVTEPKRAAEAVSPTVMASEDGEEEDGEETESPRKSPRGRKTGGRKKGGKGAKKKKKKKGKDGGCCRCC